MKLLETVDVHIRSSGKDVPIYIYEHSGIYFRSSYSGLEDANLEDINYELGNLLTHGKSKEECILRLESACKETDSVITNRRVYGQH